MSSGRLPGPGSVCLQLFPHGRTLDCQLCEYIIGGRYLHLCVRQVLSGDKSHARQLKSRYNSAHRRRCVSAILLAVPLFGLASSPRRKPGSRKNNRPWIPAFAGMTVTNQSAYCGIFSNSPFRIADWCATMPGTVRFNAWAMSTSGVRSCSMASMNSLIR